MGAAFEAISQTLLQMEMQMASCSHGVTSYLYVKQNLICSVSLSLWCSVM